MLFRWRHCRGLSAIGWLMAMLCLGQGCALRRPVPGARPGSESGLPLETNGEPLVTAIRGGADSPEPRSVLPIIPGGGVIAQVSDLRSHSLVAADEPEPRSVWVSGAPAGALALPGAGGADIALDVPAPPARAGGIDEERLRQAAGTIEPDCVLQIGVKEDSSLDGSYRVDSDGGIDFGYVGLVVLQGSTAEEAEAKIKTLLEKRYFKTASPSVRITKASYDKVRVAGAVASPGTVKIGSGSAISLREALIRAGGILPVAKEIRIKVVRGGARSVWAGPAGPGDENVALSLRDGDIEIPSIELRNNDFVYVYSGDAGAGVDLGGKEIIVLGEVRAPGIVRFSPSEPCTLMHLIFKIGGLSNFAKTRAIRIKRIGEDGEEQEIVTNASALLKTGDPDADVPLRDGDRVIVPAKGIVLF